MKKLLLILLVTLFAGAAQAQQYPFFYEVKESGGMYYAHFSKKSSIADKQLVIHYRMVFSSNRSSQNRMATILASGSQDRSQGVNEPFRIDITNYEVTGGDSPSSSQSSSSSSSSGSSSSSSRATVAPESVVWATSNVGDRGTFATSPEDYGGYYTFKQAQKACPKGWRTPTTAEFQSLVDSKSEWTRVNGVNGRRFDTGSQTIFLPAAGADGNRVVEKSGFYWSDSPSYAGGGYSLSFSSIGGISAPHVDHGTLLEIEQSVRCVKK